MKDTSARVFPGIDLHSGVVIDSSVFDITREWSAPRLGYEQGSLSEQQNGMLRSAFLLRSVNAH